MVVKGNGRKALNEPYRIAIIGCGRPLRTAGATGFGQSHLHVQGYRASGRCHLAALADVSQENAEAFAAEHGDPNALPALYRDYREMLATERPDVVSICTWPHLHAPMVIACAQAGVRAVHCEKPMAPTWGEARRMAHACTEHGTQLTFNHQRRFEAPYRAARRLQELGCAYIVVHTGFDERREVAGATPWDDLPAVVAAVDRQGGGGSHARARQLFRHARLAGAAGGAAAAGPPGRGAAALAGRRHLRQRPAPVARHGATPGSEFSHRPSSPLLSPQVVWETLPALYKSNARRGSPKVADNDGEAPDIRQLTALADDRPASAPAARTRMRRAAHDGHAACGLHHGAAFGCLGSEWGRAISPRRCGRGGGCCLLPTPGGG